ncbi:dethiobiotin synthase [Marinisporobacter balticus]|uniref:ATP-dependent dethiobiotin synthetase BioD n=1 Tax=Marinisporobacter balticus TaxID=2018667 RepID=A0A4R2KMU0_9FIRM|nr:dethiobiotin synthase [Marinisporobacter balticus]TCO74764.1 dethiobiotin synthetase [Marinisporobacter balticus]
MSKGIFIVGTDTDVGKTVVSAGLMHLLRSSGYNACYFKPVLSGAVLKNGKLIPGDTHFVKTIANIPQSLEDMTPFMFQTPVSPHLASEIENIPIQINRIKQQFEYLKQKYPYIVVEGAGGLVVPLKDQYMLYDLIKDFNLSIVVIARAGLGTINHTLLTVNFAKYIGIEVKGIILNGYDPSDLCHVDNRKTIESFINIPTLTLPKLENIDVEKIQWGNLKTSIEKNISIDLFIKWMKSC